MFFLRGGLSFPKLIEIHQHAHVKNVDEVKIDEIEVSFTKRRQLVSSL